MTAVDAGGTWPDWIEAIATAAGFTVTILLLLREGRARRRSHAVAVTFDLDWPASHDDAIASVTNGGQLPIRDVRILIWRNDGMGREPMAMSSPTIAPGFHPNPDPEFTVRKSFGPLGDIQPGATARAELLMNEPHAVGVDVAATFLDVDGGAWRIWHDGTLERVVWPLTPRKRRTWWPRRKSPDHAAQPRRP